MSIFNNKQNRKTGLSLVEALFSIGIISFVLIAILMTFVYTVDLSKRIDYDYSATNIAKSRLERIRSIVDMGVGGSVYLVESLADLNGTDITDWDGNPEIDGDFKRITTISSYGDPSLAKAEVTVIYKYKGVWREEAGTTLVTVFNDIE